MGLLDRVSGDIVKTDRGFSLIKTIVLSSLIFIMAVVAFSLNLLANRGVASYDFTDEDSLKFDKRHSADQMQRMMVALNSTCILISLFLVHNLAKMVSRPARSLGSTKCLHYVVLGATGLTFLLAIGMVVALFYPVHMKVYRYLQDSYFILQMLVVVPLLQSAIIT